MVQQQLALETMESVVTRTHAAHKVYVDGSVQGNGSSACAIYCTTLSPIKGADWTGRRLPDSSSSTLCELNGILDGITLLLHHRVNGLIVCDSQAALYALRTARPVCKRVVTEILHQLLRAVDASLTVSFVWIPSHVGLVGNERVDALAKAACTQAVPVAVEITLMSLRRRILWNGWSHGYPSEGR